MVGGIQMSDTISSSIESIADCMEDAQDSNMAVKNLLLDLDDYLETFFEEDYDDIKQMIGGIIYEVDVESDKIEAIHPHLNAIAKELSEGD